jgi:hypothetical protein
MKRIICHFALGSALVLCSLSAAVHAIPLNIPAAHSRLRYADPATLSTARAWYSTVGKKCWLRTSA